MCVHLCEEARGQQWVCASVTFFFSNKVSYWTWDPSIQRGWIPWAPGIHLSWPSQCWGYRCTLLKRYLDTCPHACSAGTGLSRCLLPFVGSVSEPQNKCCTRWTVDFLTGPIPAVMEWSITKHQACLTYQELKIRKQATQATHENVSNSKISSFLHLTLSLIKRNTQSWGWSSAAALSAPAFNPPAKQKQISIWSYTKRFPIILLKTGCSKHILANVQYTQL